MSALFDELPDPARKGTSIAGVHSGRAITHDWITPRHIIEALGGAQSFDLDVSQSPTQPWPCARRGIVLPTDGLNEPWETYIFMNANGEVCACSCHAHDAVWKNQKENFGAGLIGCGGEQADASNAVHQRNESRAGRWPRRKECDAAQTVEAPSLKPSSSSINAEKPTEERGQAGVGSAIAPEREPIRRRGETTLGLGQDGLSQSAGTPRLTEVVQGSANSPLSTITSGGQRLSDCLMSGDRNSGATACASGTTAAPIAGAAADFSSKITSSRSRKKRAPEPCHGTSFQHADAAIDQRGQDQQANGSETLIASTPSACGCKGCVARPKSARLWVNPPYSVHASAWMAKLARHGRGTALIFARTETEMFFDHVWGKASAILFLEGRLHFHYPDGRRAEANAGGPSVLIAYGADDAWHLQSSGLAGAFVSDVKVLGAKSGVGLLDLMEAR